MISKNIIKSLLSLLLFSPLCDIEAISPEQSAGTVAPEPVSQDTPVVSLEDALSRTYMQNTDLDQERAKLRATDEDVSQAVSRWRPSVTVEGQQNKSWDFPSQGRNTHNSSLSLTTTIRQNIYEGGKTIAQTRSSESGVLAGRANLFSQEQKSLFEAVQAFFAVIAKREIVEARKKNELFLERTLEQTQARFEVGEVSRTDVEASKASLTGAIAERVAAEGEYESAKATFQKIVGSPAGYLAMPKVLLPLPNTLSDALTMAALKNPTITAAQQSLEAAKHDVDVAIADLLPTLDISGSNTRQRTSQSFRDEGRNTDLTVGVAVSMPLYNRGITSSQVRQKYQIVAQNKVALEGARRAVTEAVTQAWESFLAAQKSVEQFIASVKSQELAVEGVTEEAAVGVKTVLDVLEQEKRLIDTQVSLIQAEQSVMTTSYQIFASTGQLTAKELNLNVKTYDPEKHYNDVKWEPFQFWEGEDERYVKDKDEPQ